MAEEMERSGCLIPRIFRKAYWQDLLWQVRGRAVRDGLLDSSLHILVEGCDIHPDREQWKRTHVAEGEDYESVMGFVKSKRRQEGSWV